MPQLYIVSADPKTGSQSIAAFFRESARQTSGGHFTLATASKTAEVTKILAGARSQAATLEKNALDIWEDCFSPALACQCVARGAHDLRQAGENAVIAGSKLSGPGFGGAHRVACCTRGRNGLD